jgi:mersacidin/lichenicidin family type 2 lantibiotic
MTRETIIRAWRDPEFRSNLSETERADLPEHPAGWIELEEAVLKGLAGGKPDPTRHEVNCTPFRWC